METIDIICQHVYRNSDISPPSINETTLRALLQSCTTECPFQNLDGKLYTQIDGVSMGSPLGVTFANFYMSHLENKVFENSPNLKPTVYSRYVDDCFIIVNSPDEIEQLIEAFK